VARPGLNNEDTRKAVQLTVRLMGKIYMPWMGWWYLASTTTSRNAPFVSLSAST